MDNAEALEIFVTGHEKIGFISGDKILVTPMDITVNLECNGFELDLEFIQDLTSIIEDGECEMYQGHCLAEVEF